MNTRYYFWQELRQKIQPTLESISLGTVANTIATFASLPFIYAVTQKQLPGSTVSYPQIARHVASRQGFRDVYKVSWEIMKMSPKQSLAYLGVTNAVFQRVQDQPLWMQALKAGILSSTAESIVTAKDSYHIVAKWGNTLNVNLKLSAIYLRSLQVTLLKNTISNPLTLGFILHIRYYLENQLQSRSPWISAVSAMIGVMATAPFIAPFITLQTRAQNNPGKNISWHARHIIFNESPFTFWKGCAGRAAQKSIQNFIAFGIMETGNQLINPRQKNPSLN